MTRFILAIPFVIAPTLAWAGPADGAKPEMSETVSDTKAKVFTFAELDVDGTKSISRVEAAKSDALTKDFTTADIDESGALSDTEYKAWQETQSAK